MSKGKFICIIGIDGSGKTTLTNNIIKQEKNIGSIFEYRWCKPKSIIFQVIIKIKNTFFIRENDKKKNYVKSKKLKEQFTQNILIRGLFENFSLCGYILKMQYNVSLPLFLGKNLIADRYIYDTIVDLAYDLNYEEKKISEKIEFLMRYLPQPDILIYMNISEEIAFKRKDDVPSIEFLSNKRKIYEKILEILKKKGQTYLELEGIETPENLTNYAVAHLSKIFQILEVFT